MSGYFRKLLIIVILSSISLYGCSLVSSPDPTPLPTPTPRDARDISLRSSGVVASGEVVPAQVAKLSFDRAGRILSVTVAEDEEVDMGQILAQLDGQETLEAAVIAAEMALLAAQQELDALSDDISITEAEAFQSIVETNQEIGDIQYRLYNLNIPSAYADMDIMEALEIAKERLDQARKDYEPYKYKSSGDKTRRDFGEKVEQARSDFNSILRRLENEAALKDANARLVKAEVDYETAQVGPDPDAVAMAEARLKNAEAQLEVARKALEGINLFAPISGAAVSVDIIPGDTVLPGQVVVTLADLSTLRVETTDLSERDVAEIHVGQPATVYVEALDQELSGRVARIAPQAVIVGGDVTYTVVVELEGLPSDLRWGMTVEVDITPD
jgi:multidrug efflux pump subunit AcrA (membrane-fusion protein)